MVGDTAENVEIGNGSEVDVVDVLPDDLQPALADRDEYVFPNNSRRRIPGYLYLATAALLALCYFFFPDSAYINKGVLYAAVFLFVLGAYSVLAGRNLAVDERQALLSASSACGFAVGHASAQMVWRGWLSKPVWRILLFSAEEPPLQRGFVVVDGTTSKVLESIVEDNPDDLV